MNMFIIAGFSESIQNYRKRSESNTLIVLRNFQRVLGNNYSSESNALIVLGNFWKALGNTYSSKLYS